MSANEIEFKSIEHRFGDACIRLHRITNRAAVTSASEHTHGYYELHTAVSGSYSYNINGRVLVLSAGEAVVIAPGVPHKTAVGSEGVEVAVIAMSVERTDGAAGFYDCFTQGMKNGSGAVKCVGREFVGRVLSFCAYSSANSLHTYCKRKLYACEIITGLFDAFCGDGNIRSSETPDFDIMLETFISSKNVTLRDMSACLGYSERQLSRIIKARYGKTLTELRGKKNEKDPL